MGLVEKTKNQGQARKGKRKDSDDEAEDKTKTRGKRGGVGKGGKDTAENRVQQELQKVMMVQARIAKRGQKLKRLRTSHDTVEQNDTVKKGKQQFYLFYF